MVTDSPPRLTNLPGQWLQSQADGSNVCRVLRKRDTQVAIKMIDRNNAAFDLAALRKEVAPEIVPVSHFLMLTCWHHDLQAADDTKTA